MKLHVYYDDIKVTFEGNNPSELIRAARAHELYKKHNTITFEAEEDGNQCSEC